VPISDDPQFLCPDLRLACTLIQPECPFALPLRINMGGNETVDSRGRLWLGDRPCALAPASDPLDIRRGPLGDPFLAGGLNAICDWCAPVQESFEKLGLDASHPGDRHIFSTIRWDLGTDGLEDFFIELPIDVDSLEDDFATVNLYFNECCCIGRNFKVSIQGEIVDDDVSYLDYDDVPALGKLGVLSFEGIDVSDGLLTIGFLPCPECLGTVDNNAIINAIEVLDESDVVREICDNQIDDDGDGDVDCDDSECAGRPVCAGVRFVRGDADSSGGINLTDGIGVLSFLFLGTAAPDCMDAGDTTDNGGLELTDAIGIFNYLFLGAGPPRPPSPTVANSYPSSDCGLDPTADGLGCARTAPQCSP